MEAKNKKVLIVEDNELNLKLFRDLLDTKNCQIVDTNDGREAMSLVVQEQPDLIIMDIQLPNVSGMEIIQQIKQDDGLKHIPVIAVTAFAMQEDEEQILATGCEGYLAKPISIESFLNIIDPYV